MTAVLEPDRTEIAGDRPARPSDLAAIAPGAALVVGAVVVSFVGGAAAVQYALPVVAVVLSLVLLSARRPGAYVHLQVMLWLFASGVRRVADWHTAFRETSPVLLAAPAASVVGLFFLAPRGTRLPAPFLAFLTVFGLASGYAFAVGVLNAGIVASAATFSAWGPPFFLALFLAFFPGPVAALAGHLARTSWLYLTALGGYGVLQWVVAPDWDVAWMKAIYVPGFSFGTAEPFGIRVFSLTNSPYTLGCVLVVLLAIQLTCPLTPPRVAALVLGVAALGLSGVRAAWIVLALAVVLLAARRQLNPRTAILGVLGIVVAVAYAPDSFAETVGQRIDSLGSGSSDVSFSARSDFYATVLPRLLTDSTGAGFGSTGVGVRAAGAGADTTFGNVDSAYLDMLRTFGPFFGVLVVLMLVGSAVWTWATVGSRRSPYGAFSAFLLTVPVLAFLGDIWGGAVGVFVWAGLALSAREIAAEAGATERGVRVHHVLATTVAATACVLALVAWDIAAVPQPATSVVGPCQALRQDVASLQQQRPVTTGRDTAVVLGDSYTQGVFLVDPRSQVWATRLGQEERWTTFLDGVGGTGFLNGGACGDQQFSTRLDRVLALRPDVVVIEGGLNDSRADPAAIGQALREMLQRMGRVPRVIIVGPPAAPSVPTAGYVDEVLREGALAAGREYVPTRQVTFPYLSDGLHLTAAGHQQFADTVAAGLR